MDLDVLLQVTLRGELLRAVSAFEGLVPVVNLLMPDEIAHLGKRLPTSSKVASMGSLPVMDSIVLLQRA